MSWRHIFVKAYKAELTVIIGLSEITYKNGKLMNQDYIKKHLRIAVLEQLEQLKSLDLLKIGEVVDHEDTSS